VTRPPAEVQLEWSLPLDDALRVDNALGGELVPRVHPVAQRPIPMAVGHVCHRERRAHVRADGGEAPLRDAVRRRRVGTGGDIVTIIVIIVPQVNIVSKISRNERQGY
jgi:hypothetical protein